MRYLKKILEAKTLTDITKKDYEVRLKKFIEKTNENISTIIKNPVKYIEWVNEHIYELQTQKSYIVSVIALFKYNTSLKKRLKTEYEIWSNELIRINKLIEEKYKSNKPTTRQQEGYIPFEDIVKKRDELEKGTKERLLLSMYTYIEPLRNDFNAIYLYDTEPVNPDKNNYIVLSTGNMVITEHKMGKKIKYERILPKELMAEIENSLEINKRGWLFQDRAGKEYNSNSFNRWINRELEKLFEKKITINMIRHSYINSLDMNKLSIKEKEIIAGNMAHTTGHQDKYRLLI